MTGVESVRVPLPVVSITNSLDPFLVACGYASQYNTPADQQYGIRTTSQVIAKRLTWRGLSVFDESLGGAYASQHQERVGKWISQGVFHAVIDRTKGIDAAAEGLVKLIRGDNVGKAVLDLASS